MSRLKFCFVSLYSTCFTYHASLIYLSNLHEYVPTGEKKSKIISLNHKMFLFIIKLTPHNFIPHGHDQLGDPVLGE